MDLLAVAANNLVAQQSKSWAKQAPAAPLAGQLAFSRSDQQVGGGACV